jgi:hypothetical protein
VDTLDRKFPIQFVLYEQLSGMIELIRLLKKIGLAPKKTILLEVPTIIIDLMKILEQAALL